MVKMILLQKFLYFSSLKRLFVYVGAGATPVYVGVLRRALTFYSQRNQSIYLKTVWVQRDKHVANIILLTKFTLVTLLDENLQPVYALSLSI